MAGKEVCGAGGGEVARVSLVRGGGGGCGREAVLLQGGFRGALPLILGKGLKGGKLRPDYNFRYY
ncbi:Hypothetical predicted protein [Podarcis lilfordi]|uniref:Uncharacterized protein n=1 Tax=Podarcis lilfordi TaxID=74358 RepID=A0AA35P5Q4_9SAUR|nr:Hypothetical predicted protein [Podarcis lilfordi]